MANDADQSGSSIASVSAASDPGSISAGSAGWFGAILMSVALAAFVGVTIFLPTNSLGFAALAGTAILSVSLTALIIIFRAIGVLDPEAALAFPRGSVRALLAFGLTIVFVAIASWTLGGIFDPLGPLVAQVNISPQDQAAYDTYRKRYPDADYIFTETQSAAAGSNNAGSPTDGKANATSLKVYLKRKPQDPNTFDLAKQIMTTIATVLVTIVGFYFGSHGSSDTLRAVGSALGNLSNTKDAPGPAGAPGTLAELDKTTNAINALAAATKAKLGDLGSDPVALLGDVVAKAPADDQLAAQLASAYQALDGMRKSAAACATDSDRAKDIRSSVNPTASAEQIKDASGQLGALLANATQSNHDFEQQMAQWTGSRNFILQRTAKG